MAAANFQQVKLTGAYATTQLPGGPGNGFPNLSASYFDDAQSDETFAPLGELRFETQFQFGWVVAAVLPLLLPMPGRVGYLMVGAVMVAALVSYAAGVRAEESIATRR